MMDTKNFEFDKYGMGHIKLLSKELHLPQIEMESDNSLTYADKQSRTIITLDIFHKIDVMQLMSVIEGLEEDALELRESPILKMN